MNYKFIIQSPIWFYFFAALLALLYAWLLYSKKATWGKTANLIMALLRGILVFAILFILSAPLLRLSKQSVDRPVIALLVDNSSSVAAHTRNLKNIVNELSQSASDFANDKDWACYSLYKKVAFDSLNFVPFTLSKTNLQASINTIEQDYEGQNIAALAILSDGNYNQGINPSFIDYKYPVYTLGLGDTSQKRDLALAQVQYNKIAYLGNKFIVNFKLKNIGYSGEKITVELFEKEQQLFNKDFQILKNAGEQSAAITLEAKAEGMHHYVLKCTKKDGEFTHVNNEVHLYIEVIKSKDKILILAQAPHPDGKAINATLSTGQNYDIELHFVGDGQKVNLDNANAVVLLGIPNKKGIGNDVYSEILKRKLPALYVLQNNSDYALIGNETKLLTISPRSTESDKVQASLNSKFETFGIQELDNDIIQQYPPLSVPFAYYNVSAGAEVLLNQKIGSSVSANPLWLLGNSASNKNAVIVGDGLWMWRINEKSKTQSSQNFDVMFQKTIQYIAYKSEKRKFKVVPTETEYEEGDLVAVSTEIYDAVNQPTYNHEVTLVVRDENNKESRYKYLNQEAMDKFEVGQFAQGSYSYTASVQIASKNQTYAGVFVVKKLHLEEMTSVADHKLLQELSQKTKGQYYEANNLKEMILALNKIQTKGRVRLSESYTDLIDLKWLFALLLLLVSIEWFLRKFNGGY